MKLTLETSKFEEHQAIFTAEIVEKVKIKLQEAGVDQEKLEDLTAGIALSIASTIDDTARIEANGVEVHPYLTFRTQHPGVDPSLHFALVATIKKGALKTRGGHPFVASDAIRAAINQLCAALSAASLPFDAVDEHEYWLLDDADGAPLALLQSCVDLEDRDLVPRHPSWVAMPAAQLAVPGTEGSGGTYVPPVNYRLGQAVAHRAGSRPRATWLSNAHGSATPRNLPPCLLREYWPDEEQRQPCER